MGVILIELALLAYILSKIKKESRFRAGAYFVLLFIIQIIILVFYRIELSSLGRVVYYSDAEVYWLETLNLLNGGKAFSGQDGYVQFCKIIQQTSPFVSVVWNNISNLLLVDLSIAIITYLGFAYQLNYSGVKSFYIFLMSNPLVIYGLIRNLKDALFLFITVCIVFLFHRYCINKNILNIVVAFFLTIYVTSVRPWGFLIFPLCIIGCMLAAYKDSSSGIKRIMLFLISIILIPIIYVALSKSGVLIHLTTWAPIIEKNIQAQSLRSLISGPFVILLGPGWYRSIFGYKYFMFYTNVGNICCAIGSTLWWVCLAKFASRFSIKSIFKTDRIGLMFLAILAFFLTVYTMQYGGSLEIRFRSVVYVLTSAVFLFLQNTSEDKGGVLFNTKNIQIKYYAFLFVIFTVGTIMSI